MSPHLSHAAVKPCQCFSRREMISIGAGAISCIGAAPWGPTLKAAARNAGLTFGSAVNGEMLANWPQFADLVRRECAMITPELALKWARLEPAPGDLHFTEMDAIATFARESGLRVRGHTLLWGKSVPAWAAERLASRPDWSLVSRLFASVIPRYGDVIGDWDVINEPIDVEGSADGLRDTALKRAFGADYVHRALKEARVYAPRARLMINEYGLEGSSAISRKKREAFLALLRSLKLAGAPLDGVGVQSHLDLNTDRFDPEGFAAFLEELASMRLHIALTELDVKERDYTAPVEARDRAVAQAVANYLTVALRQRAVGEVLTWGLSDRGSWLEVTAQDRGRFPDAWRDGSSPGLNRGLPYDSDLRPTPMRDAIRSAFSARGA